MRLCPNSLRWLPVVALLCAPGTAVWGQDPHDWQSLARLRAGDPVRLRLKTGTVDASFQNWSPEQVTAGTQTARKEDVLRVDRYRPGGRGKSAAIGAAIGFGGGFAIGAVAGGCRPSQVGICVSRGELGAAVGGAGAVIGAVTGALIHKRSRELIYSAR